MIQNTLIHINDIKLGSGKSKGNSYEFVDFINSMYVVIDCIKALSDIFQVDYKNITGNKNYFKKVEFSFPNYETEIVPVVVEDGEFFSYYRSLSSVHVSNTSSVPGFFKK